MGGLRLRRLAILLSVLAGSQLGHTLVYVARYGSGASRYESVGVHGYYPTLTAILGGAVGAGLMVGLLLVAAARTLLVPAGCRPRGTVRFLDVLAAVFVAQLAIFAGQETIEALAAGQSVPSVGDQLLWGTLGQLPAAAIAAAVITWLLTRLEEAWAAVVQGVPRLVFRLATPSLERATGYEAGALLRLGSAFPSAFRKRGPPRRPALT